MSITPTCTRTTRLIMLPAVAFIGFLMTASTVLACGITCHGDYFPAGTNEATSITGRSDTGVCMGSVEISECPSNPNQGGGGGGGGGGTSTTDLTTSNVTPTVAPQGESVTYSSTISNGARAAGNSTTIFQVATDASGTGAQSIGTVATEAMNPYASRTASIAYTHPNTSSFYMRACADIGNTVPESNENNNCGSWTQIMRPLNVSCSVAPSSAQVNDTVLWSATVITGTNNGLAWRAGPAFTTKICTGGQNATTPHRDCPGDIGNGASCSVEGQRCRYSSGCDGNTYTDSSGMPNAHTTYGTVVPYTCTASSQSETYTYVWNGTDGLAGTGQSLPWSYATTGTKSGTVTVTSSTGQTGSATCSLPITAQGTDLTAGGASAPGARRGATATISASIQNIGGAFADASRAYYELLAPSAKSNTSGIFSVGSIPAAGSASASFNYNFGSSGNYQVRFCADWYGEVVETNEGNNCGPWTEIGIPETPISDSVSCTASATTVTTGQAVTYTAYPVGAATSPYTWTPADGVGSYGSGSTASRTFTVPGSYGMQVAATNAGSAASCPVVTVTGGFCSAGNEDLTITATPNRLRSGQSTTITWSATGIPGSGADCTVLGPGVSWSSAVTASPQCSASGSATATITTQSTYTLTCGAYSESVTVNVIPNFQEF